MSTTAEYNGVRLEDVLTSDFRIEPALDDSGLDHECDKVTVTLIGTVNPRWWTTNKPQSGRQIGRDGQTGDRPSKFLYNVRKTLQEPRGKFIYRIGQDIVVEAPEQHTPGDGVGPALDYPCDIRGGPFTSGVLVQEVVGAKSLVARFTVTTYVAKSLATHILLSNRWSWSQDVDQYGYAIVTITGKAKFRADFMHHGGFNPDDYRAMVIPKPGLAMRRDSVKVTVDPGKMSLSYTVVDRAINYSFLPNSVAKVECVATSGHAGGNFNVSGMMNSVVQLGKAVATRDPISAISSAAALAGWVCPKSTASITARVYGRHGANHQTLYRVAQQMVFSRHIVGHPTDGPSVRSWTAWMTEFRASFDWSSDSPPMAEFSVSWANTLSAVSSDGVVTNALDDIPVNLNPYSPVDVNRLRAIGVKAAFTDSIGVEGVGGGSESVNLISGSKHGGESGTAAGSVVVMRNSELASLAVRAGRAFAQSLGAAGRSGPTPPAAPPAESRYGPAPGSTTGRVDKQLRATDPHT